MSLSSKFLAYVLRHHPEELGLKLDPDGWVEVQELLEALQAQGRATSLEELEQIVADDGKGRYSLRHGRIRANQGHSVGGVMAVDLTPVSPPERLYHGTTRERWELIQRSSPPGLRPGQRHHVHLSASPETARQVGNRHRRENFLLLIIDAAAMHRLDYRFFLSENGVWLSDFVPLEFLRPAP